MVNSVKSQRDVFMAYSIKIWPAILFCECFLYVSCDSVCQSMYKKFTYLLTYITT